MNSGKSNEYIENEEKISIDAKKFTDNKSLIENLSRPLSMLTIENVDLGLFELGKIFENALKDYLLSEKKVNNFIITNNDLSKLTNMIDCVVKHKIITKGHHLDTLREERNNRAHEQTLTKDEKRNLFNKAHYLAELFVKYICFFENKRNTSLLL